MAFWFAPVLAAWQHMGAAKSLFFSFFAGWRNWRAFIVYGATLSAVFVFIALALQLVVRSDKMLPVALFGLFPAALATLGDHAFNLPIQVAFTWLMVFGLLGLFHARLNVESTAIRFVSDASYWLYLMHLPMVLALQALFCDWPMPAAVKFIAVCLLTTLPLLATYRFLVRDTWLGLLLNGRVGR